MREFQIKSGKYSISIKFSNEASAPGIEDALVKILNGKMG